ncbi:hypothetical protein ACIPJG_11450 [Streptomyces halstedii]|uniref:hypothetical protein n=1 Tax=Streptomyces TaxID=1883 RepID=UPI00159EDC98|nr:MULTISPECIES: hypothetical protein [unclassified Streptomyces]
MQLEDVDLGNRRITVGGHVRLLDDLTRRAVLDWLGHRHSRWPNAANSRVDRQLEEALTHRADPLHLALVFGIDEKTAIRYADSARALLG